MQPRVEQRHAAVLEVGCVARDDGEQVHARSGGDQTVDGFALAARIEAPLLVGYAGFDRRDPSGEAVSQLGQPGGEASSATRVSIGGIRAVKRFRSSASQGAKPHRLRGFRSAGSER
jgi:hypothetical protein